MRRLGVLCLSVLLASCAGSGGAGTGRSNLDGVTPDHHDQHHPGAGTDFDNDRDHDAGGLRPGAAPPREQPRGRLPDRR